MTYGFVGVTVDGQPLSRSSRQLYVLRMEKLEAHPLRVYAVCLRYVDPTQIRADGWAYGEQPMVTDVAWDHPGTSGGIEQEFREVADDGEIKVVVGTSANERHSEIVARFRD